MQCILCMVLSDTVIMFAIEGNKNTFNQAPFNVAWLQILLIEKIVILKNKKVVSVSRQ